MIQNMDWPAVSGPGMLRKLNAWQNRLNPELSGSTRTVDFTTKLLSADTNKADPDGNWGLKDCSNLRNQNIFAPMPPKMESL